MNCIDITHNPFIVETTFLINGEVPAEGCKLSSYRESRLQTWIERLFDELSQLFNGDDRFKVSFKGVESDYLDVAEAAQAARSRGMQVELDWVRTEHTEVRLEKIRELVDEALSHPKLQAYFSENADAKAALDEALGNDFDVCVVATMSAGKSTLINAMLGRDLLPAANEATTATIARIVHNGDLGERFSAARITRDGERAEASEQAGLELIQRWNRMEDTATIELEGAIPAVRDRDNVRLVLTDTPGPNNSQDENHERVTMGFIQDSRRNPLILYVLNASQLSIDDDRNLLELVGQAMRKGGKQSKDRFIFVVNKMDVFDPEKGEDPKEILERVKQYLVSNGIQNPLVYPVSANLTRLIRKPGDLHSRKERGDYSTMAELFDLEPCMNMLQYMPLTSRVSMALADKQYSPLLLSSGLPAVETMIDEYIDKYSLPHRAKRASEALSRVIEMGLNEADLADQLNTDERALKKLNDELEGLQQRRARGSDVDAYVEELRSSERSMPSRTIETLVELETEMIASIRKVSDGFSGKSELSKAKARVEQASSQLRFEYNRLANLYQGAFEASQKYVAEDLQKTYQEYVLEIFQDYEELEFPAMESLRRSVADISLNLDIRKAEVEREQVVVGYRKVSTSRWYNPFSWGDEKSVPVFGDEEFVDLAKVWKSRQTQVQAEFTNLSLAEVARIKAGRDQLVDQFLAFMADEFDQRFNELVESVRDKARDRDARERAVEEGRALRAWIATFKNRLEATLAV